MARRPVYLPDPTTKGLVREVEVDFRWHAGMAASQKQKSIASLHAEAMQTLGVTRVLEISSKSPETLGVDLSAFNLSLACSGGSSLAVEVVFQGSKAFRDGGPFTDIYSATSREAKRDPRLRSSGPLVSFQWQGETWPLIPRTAFYDWLYLNALRGNPSLAERLVQFEAFTDIEFNPEKSLNCQARSAALFVALSRCGRLDGGLRSKDAFLSLFTDAPPHEQLSLWGDC